MIDNRLDSINNYPFPETGTVLDCGFDSVGNFYQFIGNPGVFELYFYQKQGQDWKQILRYQFPDELLHSAIDWIVPED